MTTQETELVNAIATLQDASQSMTMPNRGDLDTLIASYIKRLEGMRAKV